MLVFVGKRDRALIAWPSPPSQSPRGDARLPLTVNAAGTKPTTASTQSPANLQPNDPRREAGSAEAIFFLASALHTSRLQDQGLLHTVSAMLNTQSRAPVPGT